MATRPKGYGMTAEVQAKMLSKYDIELEQQARLWIELILGEALVPEADGETPLGMDTMHEVLKNGQILCRIMAVVFDKPIKFNTSNMAFKKMENIGIFLQQCESFGVNKTDLFQTVDLYEKTNMSAVINAIHAFARKLGVLNYDVPQLGPKEAVANKREFTQEQLNAGNSIIGGQMGTNRLASQAGHSAFGANRDIRSHQGEEATQEGQAVIGLQMGTNRGASQKGIVFGKSRGIFDTKTDLT